MLRQRSRSELDDLGLALLLPLAGERAASHVAQAPADCLTRVEVDDEERFLEARGSSEHLAFVVEHDGVTVEQQLVLAADEVAESEVRGVVPGARHQHLLAVFGLADVVRRRREVDEQLCARECQVGRGRPGLPDVLADRRADQDLAEPQQHELPSGREVAVFVEDAVVREIALPVERLELAVRTDCARVEEIAVEPGRPDQRGQARA